MAAMTQLMNLSPFHLHHLPTSSYVRSGLFRQLLYQLPSRYAIISVRQPPKIMTPISSRAELEFPAIASGSGGDVDMDACLGDRFSVIVAPRASLLISPSRFWRHPNRFGRCARRLARTSGHHVRRHPEAVQWFAKWAAFSTILTILTLMRHCTNMILSCNHSFRQYTHIDTSIPFLIHAITQ